MGICPLTKRMCLYYCMNFNAAVCMDSDQIRNIKDLLFCPQTIMILPKPDGKAKIKSNN